MTHTDIYLPIVYSEETDPKKTVRTGYAVLVLLQVLNTYQVRSTYCLVSFELLGYYCVCLGRERPRETNLPQPTFTLFPWWSLLYIPSLPTLTTSQVPTETHAVLRRLSPTDGTIPWKLHETCIYVNQLLYIPIPVNSWCTEIKTKKHVIKYAVRHFPPLLTFETKRVGGCEK